MQINFNTHNPNFTMAIKAEPLEKTKVANYLSKKIRNNRNKKDRYEKEKEYVLRKSNGSF